MKTTARRGKSLVDEVREVLADVVIAHVPVVKFDFRQKVTYLAVMLRRLMGAVMDPSQTDDRRATLPVAPSPASSRVMFTDTAEVAGMCCWCKQAVCCLISGGWAPQRLLRQQAVGVGGRAAGAAVRGPVQAHEQRPAQAGEQDWQNLCSACVSGFDARSVRLV